MAIKPRKAPQKDIKSYEEQLKSGKFNWKLKSRIVTLETLPNFKQFLINLEKENDIQVALLQEDVIISSLYVCKFRIPIYGFDNKARYHFIFSVFHVVSNFSTAFIGSIGEYAKRSEMDNPVVDSFINPIKQGELSIDEYNLYFNQTLLEALKNKHLNPTDYSIKRRDGGLCWNKQMELKMRIKYNL
jgi:hypothetical protein